ncbi:hypothetical protein CROQUDRAFT_31235, partial [Cronartium quercuum f. sp. fusiforme G11]
SSGGYGLGGVWRPHTGQSELVFNHYPEYYHDSDMSLYGPGLIMGYDSAMLGNYYHSPGDYYGSYQSLGLYEEQLRLMENISEAERMARWQSRLRFEELCEEERAMRYQMMAEEERMRLGLLASSYWGSRYGGYGYDAFPYSSSMTGWGSSRMPLSPSLASRYRPLYGSGYGGYGYGYGTSGCGYGMGRRSSYSIGSGGYHEPNYELDYGGSGRLGITSGSVASNLYNARFDEAKRLRRHAREQVRQARRQL